MVDAGPDGLHARGHPGKFLEVLPGELAEAAASAFGEHDAHDAVVVAILAPANQAGGFGPVDKLDDAVMAQEQLGGEIAHGWVTALGVAAYREEELVLGGRDPGLDGPFLGPAEIPAEPGAEGEEALIVLVRQVDRVGDWHKNIVTR